ncbi:hypothetical protein H0Z60_02115 [Ectothiorhodospiraceae bacterium WFHF3C12]|nr:hypothetical protein [Ectothiorhodospiraceae bacterium WFHF3C12]
MDISHIPRSFWHAISFCLVTGTLGFLWIAYSATNVSLEIADAKIELSSAIAQAKDIRGELRADKSRLLEANELLREKIERLETMVDAKTGGLSLEDLKTNGILGGDNSEIRKLIKDPSSEGFEDLDKKIQDAEQLIDKW